VVLADAEEIDAQFVSEYRFVNDVANDLGMGLELAVGATRSSGSSDKSRISKSGAPGSRSWRWL